MLSGVLVTSRGNLLIGEIQVPVWKAMPWQGDASEKLVGSCPSARKIFFLLKSQLNCTL